MGLPTEEVPVANNTTLVTGYWFSTCYDQPVVKEAEKSSTANKSSEPIENIQHH